MILGILIYLSGIVPTYLIRRYGEIKIYGYYTKGQRCEAIKLSLFSWFTFIILVLLLIGWANEEWAESEEAKEDANW